MLGVAYPFKFVSDNIKHPSIDVSPATQGLVSVRQNVNSSVTQSTDVEMFVSTESNVSGLRHNDRGRRRNLIPRVSFKTF